MKNNILSIICFLIVFFTIGNSAFAELSLQIDVSKQEAAVWEIVDLELELSSDEQQNLEIEIPWLENFQIVSQNQQRTIQSLNGVSQTTQNISLWIVANQEWTFTLWPVEAWKTLSNSLELVITASNSWNWSWTSSSSTNWLWNDESLWNQWIEEPKLEDLNLGTGSTDIRDIQKPQSTSPFALLPTLIAFLLSLCILLGYYIYKLIRNNHQQEQLHIEPEMIEEERVDYFELLSNIEKYHIQDSKDSFYGKLWELLRLYISREKWWNLHDTFEELEKKMQSTPELLTLYKKVYFPEYNKEEDSTEVRKDIITDINYFFSWT